MDFNYSKKSLDLQEKLLNFFDDHIYPNEETYDAEIEQSGNSLHIPDLLDELKNKALDTNEISDCKIDEDSVEKMPWARTKNQVCHIWYSNTEGN